jgi:hypothetical protein
MNPVSIMAHVMCFSPNMPINTAAIFCAAPLCAMSLPNIAPKQMIATSEPSMLPSPFSIEPGILSIGSPST